MCLATPSKVIKIEGEWAEVDSGQHTHLANLGLAKNVKLGDYVIVHGDLVLNKVDKKDALKILKMTSKNICKTKV